MALTLSNRHSEKVHNGPSPRTPLTERCCGNDLNVVALTREGAAPSRVELVRCSACGLSSWRLDGVEVSKEQALGVISAAYSRTSGSITPPAAVAGRPAPAQRRSAKPRPKAQPGQAATPSAELSDLLAGWQVLGSH